ncbi:sodium:phosphate symporter [Haloferax namakaokahaiae]|uniref:Sodium:phosphate symporter n=1 Tax=Haloferax namakaokahaiae TaxID=1748331 RepID=A0ABD5ZAT2_9EURY
MQATSQLARLREVARPLGALVVGVAAFLLSIRLLSGASAALSPSLVPVLDRVVMGPLSALGASWLATYPVLNGTAIAALSMVLYTEALVTPLELFLMICGSRFGSVTIVLLVGSVEYVRQRDVSLRDAMWFGVLSFLVTWSVYLPVTALGYVTLAPLTPRLSAMASRFTLEFAALDSLEPFIERIVETLGPLGAGLVALGLLLGSLRLFDSAFDAVDVEQVRDSLARHGRNHWFLFAIGFVVTALSTSVAFSLGVVVPLSVRGYVERDELLPYILGANVGTLIDTVAIAIVLDEPVGLAVVLFTAALATLVATVFVVAYPWYEAAIETIFETAVETRRHFLAFLGLLVALPLVLLVVERLV